MAQNDEFIEHIFDSPASAIKANKSNEEHEIKPAGDMVVNDITSLKSWIDIIAKQGGVSIGDIDMTLNFFGENDETFLLIYRFTSKNGADVYYFKTEDNRNPLASLIQWLGCINYSLKELIELLDNSQYHDTEIGDELRHFGMIITRKHSEHLS
ncbi:hypothetical protein [Aliikangiella maris]|uniref:Uncharacterized protein n=2 Tax=Aliikangiella maris TaxID=3162458 RepID=A0ABV2C054_9GAMM